MFQMILKTVFTLVVGAILLWLPTAVAATIAVQMFIKLAPNYADLANVGLITFLTYAWARAVIDSIGAMLTAVRKYFAMQKEIEKKRAEWEQYTAHRKNQVKRSMPPDYMKQYRNPDDKP